VPISRDTSLRAASYLSAGIDLGCNLVEVTLVQMQESASGTGLDGTPSTKLCLRKYSDGSDYGTVSIR
jgi:hypothetical protein